MYRALLVCNSLYEADTTAFHELHGPRSDGLALRDALLDSRAGLFDTVDVLFERKLHETAVAVNRFFSQAKPDDVLLFYFSGHGLTRNQRFYLCTRDTDTKLLPSTALSGPALAFYVEESVAQCTILILDCCHSGAFKSTGAAAIAEQLAGKGRFVITATTASGLAQDAEYAGQTSPFTRALVEGLLAGAADEDQDGFVDLDDLYRHLLAIRPGGGEPQRKFDGSGLVRIARRSPSRPDVAPSPFTEPVAEPAADLHFLDVPTNATSFSPEKISEFRANLRADIARKMPQQLTAAEFLQRAHLLSAGYLTRAGALLFGESPSAALPTAIVQCTRFHGVTKGVAFDKEDLTGSVAEQIIRAVEFVGAMSRRGEAPTEDSPIARPVYRYPMVAVREIVANALVHRDYEHGLVCVHVRVFDDRVEVSSPGGWTTREIPAGESLPLDQLESDSHRRNFRLASTLTWMRLVEGEGSGIRRAIDDCRSVGAPRPTVVQRDGIVTVTIFPRDEAPDLAALELMSLEEAAFALERMEPDEAVERLLAMAPEYAARRIKRMSSRAAALLLERMDPDDAVHLLKAIPPAELSPALASVLERCRLAAEERRRTDERRPTRAEDQGTIFIQIEQDEIDSDDCIVSSWIQWGNSQPQRFEDRSITAAHLEQCVQEIIERAEISFADHSGVLTVEFILPLELLNEPVETWAKAAEGYPVVVRSLDRIRSRQLHRVWRGRWRRLSEAPEDAAVYFVDPRNAKNLALLDAALHDPDIVALVLDNDPDTDEVERMREIRAGLRAGIPVIIWRRGGAHPEWQSFIRMLLADGGVARLPEQVRRLRLHASMQPEGSDPLAKDLVLLWDDPDRQPDSNRSDARQADTSK